ncbi:MAG: 50S ribosomal protein L13 [Candidatus Cyclonatronum sp.]|uniref:50S ribosomal protein L13 n=1 Tax=Cyclonatronum sp. TaxID=3024185 RepID=UPI0025C4949A|nr:50S ribosomal protein L13 [Cyclonatronum sp.]MCC5934553.1 50S ribosomal protein L13 [Balneolales bacterium]MCH8485481.1 50S ribosomal protein L13 [Cyclonatronum sp.]
MKSPYFKTYSAKPDDIEKKWILVDAEGEVLGRLASKIAIILRGKHKPEFTPHMDTGDNVVVINAEKIRLTGKKMTDKQYFSYSGYPGGERFTTPAKLLEKKPTDVITKAVKGMLPKNALGRQLLRNLRVYAGPVHQHTAQQPEKVTL